MMFHHLVTIYLYTFSYLSNTLIGAVVAYIHDIGDVFVCLTRIFAEMPYILPIIISYFTMVLIWFYTRLTIFPYVIYVATI